MIKSFKGKWTQAVFRREVCRGLSAEVKRMAYRQLAILDAAGAPTDLRLPPKNRLEKLAGDRAGQYSLRINDQWRICFSWKQGDAYEVEIADYR